MRRFFSVFPALLLALLLLGAPSGLMAQEAQADPSLAFGRTISAEDFKAHLHFLADDLLEGRETGERGQALAALYIRTHFMRLGLQPGVPATNSYFQPYYLTRTEVEEASLSVNGQSFTYLDDFFASRSYLPENLEGDWVFAGYGIQREGYDNLEGLEVAGKNVLILPDTPEGPAAANMSTIRDWRYRTSTLEELGARNVIILLNEEWYGRLSRIARRQALSTEAPEAGQMAVLYASAQLGDALLNAVKGKRKKLTSALANEAKPPSLKFQKLKIDYQANVENEQLAPTNVLGFLEGTDKKDEVLVITGHYDHIGVNSRGEINNGADDDGSGTTGVLEVAEAFALAAEQGYRPRRSILFMTVSGEEKGLLGSAYYADHPVYPLENTVVNLNMDMIGRIDPKYQQRADSANYIYLIGSDKLSSELHALSEEVNDTYSQMTLDYTYNDENDPNRFYYRSDHYNFAKNGIPVIFYFNGTHEDYHRPTDTVEKIRYEKAARVARLVFHTAWEIANREDRITVDKDVK